MLADDREDCVCFFPLAFAQQSYADDQRVIQTGEPVVDKTGRLEWPDGRIRWLSTTKVPIKDNDGQVTGIVGISRDINERVKAEQQIRELNTQLEATNRYLAALHDTGLELINRLDLDELLEAIIVRSGALVGTANGFIFMLDEANDRMIRKVSVGTVISPDTTLCAARGEGIAGYVWDTGQPLVVNDYDSWESRRKDISPGFYHSLVGIPLISGQQVIGVLALSYTEPGRIFTEDQVELLTRFAHLAAIALNNARLYDAAQRELAERRKVEATLRESEARLQLVTRQMPAALWTTDRELRVTSGTGRLRNYLQPPSDWKPGQSLWEFYQQNDPSLFPIARHLSALQGESVDCEYNHQGYTFQCLIEPFHDTEGQVVGCIGLALDITESKRAAEQIKRFDEQRRRLSEISQSILGTLEFDEVVQQIMRALKDLLNHEICALFRYDTEAGMLRLIGLSQHEHFTKNPARIEALASEWCILNQVVETGKGAIVNDVQGDPPSIIRESQTLKRLGPNRHLHTMIVPFRAKERLLGALAMLRVDDSPFIQDDLNLVQLFSNQTALALVNAELFLQVNQSKAALARAVHHRDEFLTPMSHELRSPPSPILGMAEVLQDQT